MGENSNLACWDDELEFNTQISSQWDSLCHVITKDSGVAYNGFRPTHDVLQELRTTEGNLLPTIDQWHVPSRGGIVGRGVLIDFKGYIEDTADATDVQFDPLEGHRITVEEIEQVARHQGVEFKPGDILIVRTGFTEMLADPSPADIEKISSPGGQGWKMSGVHGSEETARWLWNRRFSAVAGDALAFEAIPPLGPDGNRGDPRRFPFRSQVFGAFLWHVLTIEWQYSICTASFSLACP